MKIPELEQLIKNSALFGHLDENVVRDISDCCIVKTYEHGVKVVKAGEISNGLYLVFSGSAQVQKEEGLKAERIATLQKGDFFGEQSIISNNSAEYTILAHENLVVAFLSIDDFNKILSTQEGLDKFVHSYVANRSLQIFLKNFGSFGALTHQEVSRWVANLNFEEARDSGSIIFREGDDGDKFYIIASGSIEIVKNINGEESMLALLGEGKFFGEMALLSNAPRAATTRCVGETTLISIDKAKFTELVESNPNLSSKIKNIIDMYMTSGVPRDAFLQTIQSSDEYDISSSDMDDEAETFKLETASTEMGSAIACITMLGNMFDIKVAKKQVANYVEKYKFEALTDPIVDLLGIKATHLEIDTANLDRVKTPFIALAKDGPVLVVSSKSSSYTIADPRDTYKDISKKEFENTFEKQVIVIDAPLGRVFEDHKINFFNFLGILRPHKRILFEILGATLFISLLSLLPPVFIRILLDEVIVQRNETTLSVLVVALVLIAIFSGTLNAIKTYLQFHLSSKLQVAILGRFYRHLISLPVSFFLKKQAGDLLSDFGDGKDTEKFLTKITLTIIVDGSMFLIFSLAMLFSNLKLFLVAACFGLFFGSLIFAYTYYIRKYMPKTLSRDVKTDVKMLESIKSIPVLKVFNKENTSRAEWERMYINKISNINKYIMINSISGSAVTAFRSLSLAVLLGYGAVLALSNEISIGQALSFNMIMMLALVPFGNIIQVYNDIDTANFYASGLNKIYAIDPEGGAANHFKPNLAPKTTNIKFENISFSYESSKKMILSGFSLSIPGGQYTAVVGRIGSGKSTLINLLTRILSPNSGRITIGSQDIANVNLKSLRSHIGVVFQDTYLFAGTIKDNISFGLKDATLAQIIEASTLAGAHEFISQMPDGYDTKIGDGGLGLSSGQKRMISIARALISNPPIVIMDEPTNDLDTEAEQIFKKNIKTIASNRTLIVITHNSGLIRDADNIAILEDGKIVEYGKHAELIDKRGYYFYLSAKQLALA